MLPARVLGEVAVAVEFDKRYWPQFVAWLVGACIHQVAEYVGGILYRCLQHTPAAEVPVALSFTGEFACALFAYACCNLVV